MSGGGGSTEIKDTKAQKALASIAARRFNLYQKTFVPLENQFITDVYAMMDPQAFNNVAGLVNAVQQPQFQQARKNLQDVAFAQGMDPTSGQYQARAAQMAQNQAAGMGQGVAQGLSGQVDRYYQGMGNIIQMGQGQAGDTIAGLGDIARQAQQVAGAQAATSQARNLATGQMVGTAVGTGIGLFGTLGSGFGGGSGGGSE